MKSKQSEELRDSGLSVLSQQDSLSDGVAKDAILNSALAKLAKVGNGRGTYTKIKSLGDAKILKLDPYFSNCYSKKIKKSFDFRK